MTDDPLTGPWQLPSLLQDESRAAPPQNAVGPRGTYGCSCVSRDARNCSLMRYGYTANCDGFDEQCDCLCHQWESET